MGSFSEEPEYELVRVDKEKKVEDGKTIMKIAAMKEKKTGSRFAHMAQTKGGSDDYVPEAITDDIETMGGDRSHLEDGPGASDR